MERIMAMGVPVHTDEDANRTVVLGLQADSSEHNQVAALAAAMTELLAARQEDQRRYVLIENRVEVEAALAGRPNSGKPGACAVRLQQKVRMFLAASQLRTVLNATAQIQLCFRRRLALKAAVAIRIQRAARGKRHRTALASKRNAATRLQRAFRQYAISLSLSSKTGLKQQLLHAQRAREAIQQELEAVRSNLQSKDWLQSQLRQLNEQCGKGGYHDWRDCFDHHRLQFLICAKCEVMRDPNRPFQDCGQGLYSSYLGNHMSGGMDTAAIVARYPKHGGG
eukprot:5068004-Prymnesium_polylepis.1